MVRQRAQDLLVHDSVQLYNSAGSTVETAIRNAIIKFEQEFMGRGPDDVRASIVRDLVVVRLKGVLTPAERQLAKTAEGVDMVKRLRQNLIALCLHDGPGATERRTLTAACLSVR